MATTGKSLNRRALVAGLVVAPLVARAQAEGWQQVIAPDLGFLLDMPAPVKLSTAAETEKGHVGPRRAWLSQRDGEMFDFDYVDYESGWPGARDSRATARELGRGDVEKAFPRSKFKYTRDEAVVLQGWDGYALDIEDGEGSAVLMRTYIVGVRLYRFLTTHKRDEPSRAAARRFVESFKLSSAR